MIKILIFGGMIFVVLSAWAAYIAAGRADRREEKWLRERSNRKKKGD